MADELKDLAIVPVTSSDTNYFLRKVTGLKIDKTYSFKFQWVLEDDTKSDWSPGYQISTPTEEVPIAPSVVVPATAVGNIPVTLSVFPANTKRVDIYIIGGVYGTGKVADSFFAAGTKTISISDPGVYQVVLIAVTPSGINGDPTNTFTVTVSGSSVDTTVIPGAPTSVVVTGFNEPSDPLNRTGYATVTFAAGSGSKGHSIGLWTSTPGSTDPVRMIPADGTSTKVEGLFVGSEYYFRVRSFNQFNNPSAWVAPTLNYPVTIPGSVLVPGQVTVSGSPAPKSIVVSWGDPSSNASLVTSGGYYEVKLYTNSGATGAPLETRKSWSNQASFSGLTTGTSYWVTVQPYTAGSTPVAGTVSSIYGPLVPTAIDNPDLKGDFILASNQLQVGGTSGANDIHLSAYTKTVGSLSTAGRIYIGGPETSTSVAVGIYNDSGTPFYADNLGRFSLGDKLTWSGNLSTPQLNVKGTIDVTGASTFSSYVLTGATNSAFVGIGYQVPYRVSSVLQSGANGLTGIVINSSGTATNSDYIKSDGTFRLAGGALTFIGNTLAVSGNITANSLAANTDLSGLSISGTTGTFTGGLSVGQGTAAILTNAVGNGSEVTYYAYNSLAIGDTVSISGIANNGPFLIPDSNPAQYYYTANAYNLSNVLVTHVTSTTFKVASGVVNSATQSYTSGGTVTAVGFRVFPSGIVRAYSGHIGGWQIDATQLRSFGTNYITLNPLTPRISLVNPNLGTISIDPVEGIVGPNVTIAGNTGPGFSFSPNGNATLRGTIYANQGIFSGSVSGANITMTGTVSGYGTASTKLLFQDSNYAISAGSSSFEYPNTGGYYDVDGEWVSSGGTLIATNNDIRFTDATKAGAVPQSTETFSYGELWLGSGTNQKGTIDLFANYPGDYIGISILADKTTQNIIIKGPASAGFETVHRSSSNIDSTSESPAFLQVDSDGRLTRGRAIFSGGSSSPSSNIGLQGDLYFSTAV